MNRRQIEKHQSNRHGDPDKKSYVYIFKRGKKLNLNCQFIAKIIFYLPQISVNVVFKNIERSSLLLVKQWDVKRQKTTKEEKGVHRKCATQQRSSSPLVRVLSNMETFDV
jgi:hypothetical protein